MTIKEQIYIEDKYRELKKDLELMYKNNPIGKNETEFNEFDEWFEQTKILEELIDFIESFSIYAGYTIRDTESGYTLFEKEEGF